jgi:hypothetical protein
MFFQECGNLANDHPQLKGVIAKIDKLLFAHNASSVFRPDDIASIFGEKVSQVSSVFDGLVKTGLLHEEKYLECPKCPNLIDTKEYEDAVNNDDSFECTQCQRDISELTLTETVRYRLNPARQSQKTKEDEKPAIDIAKIINKLRADKGVKPTPLPSELRIQFKDPEYRSITIETKINNVWQWIESENKAYKLTDDLRFPPLQTAKRKALSNYLLELAAGTWKIPRGKRHSKEQDKLAKAKERLNTKLMSLFGLEQEPIICSNSVYKTLLEIIPYKAPEER